MLRAALLEVASMETLLEAMLRVGQWDDKSPQILLGNHPRSNFVVISWLDTTPCVFAIFALSY